MKITDRKLLGLKPKKNAYDVRDQDCFVARVNKSGSITFQYVPRINGKEKRIKIGRYPSISLAEAREKHRELIKLRDRGELDKKIYTYIEIFTQYIEKFGTKYADNGKEFRRIHEKDILSHIGHIDITELSKSHVLPIQEAKRKTPRQANITVEKVSRVMRYAAQLSLVPYNPMVDFPKLEENEPRQNVLTTTQIKDVIKNRNRSTVDQIYYIMLCTGMRGGEVKNMLSGGEISRWLDVKQRKGGKVSVKAVYIPVTVRKMTPGKISDNTSLAMYCRRQKRGYTPHDIRRTAATLLVEELGFADYLVDRWLGHSVSRLKKTYIVSQRTDDLRRMTICLNRWLHRISDREP